MGKPFAASGRHSPRSPVAGGAGTVCSWKPGVRCLTILLLLAGVVFPSVLLYCAVDHRHYTYRRLRSDLNDPASLSGPHWPSFAAAPDTVEHRLDTILKEASMDDKTVILTTLNSAWAGPNSVVDLFIESFRIGIGTRMLLDHMVIIALDPKAYEQCILVHSHCYALSIEGVDFSGEKHFMSDGYLDMMWRRVDFLRTILEMGYNFIFTDVDIMWFRNPLSKFYSDGDFQIACDHFFGNVTDLGNRANGGFNYVKSNNRTIEFYKYWYASRERFPGQHDQDVFNTIKYDPFVTEIGLTMRFLSTAVFGGLCEPSKDLNEVCTMHANCCIGLESKLHDLRVMLEDWKKFLSVSENVKKSNLVSWRVPQNCRHRAYYRACGVASPSTFNFCAHLINYNHLVKTKTQRTIKGIVYDKGSSKFSEISTLKPFSESMFSRLFEDMLIYTERFVVRPAAWKQSLSKEHPYNLHMFEAEVKLTSKNQALWNMKRRTERRQDRTESASMSIAARVEEAGTGLRCGSN